MKANLMLVIGLALFGAQAIADVVCTMSTIAGGQESPCSSMQIPDETTVSSNLTCNGYKVTVDCDLHSNPNKLSLSIAPPQGPTVSTSTKNQLKLVDGAGNGAAISCVAQ